jgi:pimeloyl-ACP methyl ester carboxylesterase
MKDCGNLLSLFASIITCGIYGRYKLLVNQFIQKMENRAKIIDSPFGKIQYAEIGSGPELLYSHGGSGGYDVGLLTAQFLPGLRVISPSRFGYLRTTMPKNASPQLQADAYAFLLDELGIDKITVLGTSGGGPAALYFAINHSDRCKSVVLLSAITMKMPAFSPATSTVFRLMQNGFIYWILSSLLVDALLSAGPGVTTVEKRLFSKDSKAYLCAVSIVKAFPNALRAKAALWDVSFLSRMEKSIPVYKIGCPILVFHGASDKMVPVEHARYITRNCPQAELHLVENGSHFCCVASHGKVFPKAIKFVVQNNNRGFN